MKTITATSHYDKSKTPKAAEYRQLTANEAANLSAGSHVQFVTRFGTVANAKVNGKPKTWKTRPGDVDVPLKYGMYEYFVASYRNGEATAEQLVEETR